MKKPIRKINKQKIKPALFIGILSFFLISYSGLAQPANPTERPGDINVVTDSLHYKIRVQFTSPQTIYNVLVVIMDSVGRTIFLDNKYQFSGSYNRNIDLSPGKKGKYSLQVIRDKDRFSKKIQIQ